MDSEEIYKQAILFRRWLHRHPEVSTQEFQTQAFVIDVLKEYKIPYKTYGTGIIATLGEGADCVALRADMDALRVQEDTGLPYCSETSGLMHACGHDMHTAMLLGAAIILKSKEAEMGGTLKLFFNRVKKNVPEEQDYYCLICWNLPYRKPYSVSMYFPDYRLDRSVYVREPFLLLPIILFLQWKEKGHMRPCLSWGPILFWQLRP